MIEKLAIRYLDDVETAWKQYGKTVTLNVWTESQGLPFLMARRLRRYLTNVGVR